MSPKPSSLPGVSGLHDSDLGSSRTSIQEQNHGRTICSEPDGLSFWKRSGKRGGRTVHGGFHTQLGHPGASQPSESTELLQMFSGDSVSISSSLKQPEMSFFPHISFYPSRSGCSRLTSQLPVRCVPGSTESFIQGGQGSSSIFQTPSEEDDEDEVSPPQAAASCHILGQ